VVGINVFHISLFPENLTHQVGSVTEKMTATGKDGKGWRWALVDLSVFSSLIVLISHILRWIASQYS